MATADRSPRQFTCPRCGARPGASCTSDDGQQWADHAERVTLSTGRPIASGRVRDSSPAIRDNGPSIPAVAIRRRLPRETVRRVSCPQCGAPPGEPCTRVDGMPRRANHAGRVALAVDELIR
jgi:transcription elongation factor Elf1